MTDTSTTDLSADGAAPAAGSQHRLLLPTLTSAIFLSAALLFAVQPMFTKMVLPRLGGAPGVGAGRGGAGWVWWVVLLFCRAALWSGYAYAPLLTRYAPGRKSVVIHLA